MVRFFSVLVLCAICCTCSSPAHAFVPSQTQPTPLSFASSSTDTLNVLAILSAVQTETEERTDAAAISKKQQQQQQQHERLVDFGESSPLFHHRSHSVFQEEVAERIEIRCDSDASSSSNDDDSNNQNEPSQKRGHNNNNDEKNERDDGGDNNTHAERRKLAARAALLGSRTGSRASTTPTTSSRSTKSSTSVGDRRTGSATKARQGPGMTKRIMDAVRKSASVQPPQGQSSPDSKNDTKNKENRDDPSCSGLATRVQPRMPVSGIHAAVMEMMDRQRKDRQRAQEEAQLTSDRQHHQQQQQEEQQLLFPQPTVRPQMVPPAGTGLLQGSTETIVASTAGNNRYFKFPDCLTVRVATPRCDIEIAHLRLSVFSDFTPEVRRQLVPRSVKAVVTRRQLGATCLIATVPPSLVAMDRNRAPVILGSAEVSFHEFQGTTLGRQRPPQSIIYITEVAVSPNARRRGIGAKLLEVSAVCRH